MEQRFIDTYLERYFVLIALVLLLLMYYPIWATYSLTDGYEFFRNAKRNPIFGDVFIQGGRPIYGWFVTILFGHASSISDLRYIRLVSFVGNSLTLYALYRFLKHLSLSPHLAEALTLSFASSALIGLSMGWAVLFQAGWSLLTAVLAGILTLRGIDSNAKIPYYATAIVLGLVSLMIYQPTFTIFIFVVFLGYEKDQNLRKSVSGVVIFLLIFAIYYVLFKVMLWQTHLVPQARSGINFDIVTKLKWFADTAFVNSLGLNLLLINNAKLNLLRIPLLGFYLFCIIKYFNSEGFTRRSISYALGVCALYLMAYIPNLVSLEYHASNRSLGIVVLLNVYFLFKGIHYCFPDKIHSKIIYLGFVVLFCTFGFTNLRYGITKIQRTEYAILRAKMGEILKADAMHQIRVINLIRPEQEFLEDQGIVLKESGGEFGLLSNSVDWATRPMFETLLEELAPTTGHDPNQINFHICSQEDRAQCASETPLIDIPAEFLLHYKQYY